MSALAQLVIEVTLLQNQIYAGGQCPVKISVRNTGREPVFLNTRLAVGYRNSTSRIVCPPATPGQRTGRRIRHGL
jgi:hypothetical protein